MKFKVAIIGIIFILTSCAGKLFYKPVPEVKPPSPQIKNINVALVLGAGGSKSYAHLGVIEVLEKNNIPIDLIIGTSSGSGVGALYADSKDLTKVKQIFFGLKKWDLLDISLINGFAGAFSLFGTVSGYKMQQFLYHSMNAKSFHELKIPLVVVAADIENGKEFIFDSGPIAPAVVASASIPPAFSPMYIYGRKLIDGGVILPVPVEVAHRYRPRMTIAVDISSPPENGKPFNMADLTYKSLWITYYKLCRMQSKQADIDIHPNTYGFGIFEDNNADILYQRGKEAATMMLPKIKARMKALGIHKSH